LDDRLLQAVFSKISEIGQDFGQLFSHEISYVLLFDKKSAVQQFGRFFTNSSGHPDAV
jgi:hypothetical protein